MSFGSERDRVRPRRNYSSPVRGVMWLMSLAVPALFLSPGAACAQAQELNPYLALNDLFSADFPAAPTIRESTYTTALGIILPARVYTAEDDFGKYSVTVVDWRNAEELYEAFLAGCQDCDGAMPNDIRGAALHAARHWTGFRQRGATEFPRGDHTWGRWNTRKVDDNRYRPGVGVGSDRQQTRSAMRTSGSARRR